MARPPRRVDRVAAEGEWIGTELPLHPGMAGTVRDRRDRLGLGVVRRGSGRAGRRRRCSSRPRRGVAHLGMAIIEGHRGAGLGRALLDAAVEWAREARLSQGHARGVAPQRAGARRLYERAGFADEGYLTRHYRRKSGALWDAVVMSLILDEDSPGRP